MHIKSEPPILYFGTPVVLISTLNEDETYNLSPMSSAFWLGWRCMLGLSSHSKTPQNMIRTGECVLNLPSVNEVAAVNCLALTTGSNPVPEFKVRKGYRHESDKFGISGLTPVASETVAPPRVRECPIQLEATVVAMHHVAEDTPGGGGQLFPGGNRDRPAKFRESGWAGGRREPCRVPHTLPPRHSTKRQAWWVSLG